MDKQELRLIAEMISKENEDIEQREREAIKKMKEEALKASNEHNMFYELVASGMSTREAKRKLVRMAKRKKK